jgi:hypothetical protein
MFSIKLGTPMKRNKTFDVSNITNETLLGLGLPDGMKDDVATDVCSLLNLCTLYVDYMSNLCRLYVDYMRGLIHHLVAHIVQDALRTTIPQFMKLKRHQKTSAGLVMILLEEFAKLSDEDAHQLAVRSGIVSWHTLHDSAVLFLCTCCGFLYFCGGVANVCSVYICNLLSNERSILFRKVKPQSNASPLFALHVAGDAMKHVGSHMHTLNVRLVHYRRGLLSRRRNIRLQRPRT